MAKLKADIDTGLVVEPGRKKRSDIGGTHAKPSKKRQRPTKDSQAGPSKRRCTKKGKQRDLAPVDEDEDETKYNTEDEEKEETEEEDQLDDSGSDDD